MDVPVVPTSGFKNDVDEEYGPLEVRQRLEAGVRMMKAGHSQQKISGLFTDIYFINSSVNRMISGASLSRCLFVTRVYSG